MGKDNRKEGRRGKNLEYYGRMHKGVGKTEFETLKNEKLVSVHEEEV